MTVSGESITLKAFHNDRLWNLKAGDIEANGSTENTFFATLGKIFRRYYPDEDEQLVEDFAEAWGNYYRNFERKFLRHLHWTQLGENYL